MHCFRFTNDVSLCIVVMNQAIYLLLFRSYALHMVKLWLRNDFKIMILVSLQRIRNKIIIKKVFVS